MSFFDELKRRNVIRVGIAYVIGAWALAQVAEFAVDNFGAPQWALQTFVVFLILGLPVALFLTWAFELTPEGIKRDVDVDRDAGSIHQQRRKLDIVIIAVLSVALIVLLVKEFVFVPGVGGDEVAATDRRSIAVLPFQNMSDDNDNFADGLTEEILNVLVKNRQLRVAGRTSAFAFKGKNPSAAEVGESLNVDHYLEGSVRRSGNTLRVTAQLINVDDGFHAWSETYDREMADIFDIQDDIARQISRQLDIRLSPEATRYTDNVDAYALYVEVLPYIANNDDPNLIEIAGDLLDRALSLDPDFAKACEAWAMIYWLSGGTRIESAEARTQIATWSGRALELDDALVLARYLFESSADPSITWIDYFAAGEKAFQADPENFDILRSWCNELIHAGYFAEARQCTDRMIRLEPLSPVGHWRSGNAYRASGLRDEAHVRYARAAELGGSDYAWALVLEAVIENDFDSSIRYAIDAPDEFGWQPADIEEIRQLLIAGDSSAIAGWIERKSTDAANFYQRNSVYYWYLGLGEFDRFWAVVDQLRAEAAGDWDESGFLLEYANAFRETGVTGHAGYLRYAESTGLIDLWEQRGPPDFCSKDNGEWVCN